MMAKFVYLYSGGQAPETAAAQEESMQAWGAWFGALGDSVVDAGNQFGGGSTVSSQGVATGAASGLGGYSVVNAGSLVEAAAKADGCPIVESGGRVEIYEAAPM
jgi:hypothetical protein